MEVPHHSHGHSSSKNWKSYVGEFLMLFFAVFSGFIAENLRENYVEKERAHQYISSMVADLKKDTLQLQLVINANKKLMKGIDSLLFYLRSQPSNEVNKKLYIYSSAVGASILFEGESGTMAQLKNAGGLRLIKDTASVNKIASYDQFNEVIKKQGDAYYRSTLELLTLVEGVMDFSVAQAADSAKNPVFFIDRDPVKLRLLYNKSFIHKRIIMNYSANLGQQKKQGDTAIAVLRKNYHLN
ncbi:MAG: hypothetical protein JWQ30_482 [Sediminibacterium sp.]|nr:hypothetical protein [Sediminibacterium sp.]